MSSIIKRFLNEQLKVRDIDEGLLIFMLLRH